MSSKKRIHSAYYFKRKTFDNISKAKDKFISKNKNKLNTNKTNYSSFAQDKTSLSNQNLNIKKDINKFSLSKDNTQSKISKISLKKDSNPPMKYNFFSSSSSSNFRKFIDNNNNIYINYKNMNNNSEFLIKSYNHDSKIFQKLNNSESKRKENLNLNDINNQNSDSTNVIRTFNRKLTFRHLNILIKQYKYKNELKNEEEKKSDKICLLKKDFKVKNFILNPNQVIDYLNLNEKNNFFKPLSPRKSTYKLKKKFNFLKYNRNQSAALIENRYDKIKKIYPTVLNIEGQRNRKILYELNDENKKKKKNKKNNCVYYRHHFNLQKRMFREKSKAEECSKANISDLAYKSQLLILSMKMYQRAIHQLQKKNSLRFNLDLPLYNMFLNLD